MPRGAPADPALIGFDSIDPKAPPAGVKVGSSRNAGVKGPTSFQVNDHVTVDGVSGTVTEVDDFGRPTQIMAGGKLGLVRVKPNSKIVAASGASSGVPRMRAEALQERDAAQEDLAQATTPAEKKSAQARLDTANRQLSDLDGKPAAQSNAANASGSKNGTATDGDARKSELAAHAQGPQDRPTLQADLRGSGAGAGGGSAGGSEELRRSDQKITTLQADISKSDDRLNTLRADIKTAQTKGDSEGVKTLTANLQTEEKKGQDLKKELALEKSDNQILKEIAQRDGAASEAQNASEFVPLSPEQRAEADARRAAQLEGKRRAAEARKLADDDIDTNDDLNDKVGKGRCRHAAMLKGDRYADCDDTKNAISAGEIIGQGSVVAGTLSTQIQNSREINNVAKDGATQARQARAAARMAETAGQAQLGVTALNMVPAFWQWKKDIKHSGNAEDIENETKDAKFRGASTENILTEENQSVAAEDIANRAVSRVEWSRQKRDGALIYNNEAEARAYREEVHRKFTNRVKEYGRQASEEHAAMAKEAEGGYLKSLGLALQNAIGAWGNLRAAKEMKAAARDLEKSGDFTVPDFKSDPFPTDGDAGRVNVLPQPQPSAETAQADVLPESDVPNLGDGFKTDNNTDVKPGPVAGAFKPDENKGGASAGAGGGLSGSGTNAATAEEKQTPQAQYAGLGKGSGTFEREGGRGGNAGRGSGRGEGNGAIADMMGYFKNLFSKEEEGGNKRSDFMALGRQTAASGNDGLLGRGVNIFDRISMTYTSRAKTGTFGN